MALHQVTATFTVSMLVESRDQSDLVLLATESARAALIDEDPQAEIVVVREITALDQLPPGWSGERFPYGAPGNQPIEHLLTHPSALE